MKSPKTLLAGLLFVTACSIAVPSQFSCPEPGKPTGCGANQICGADKLCTTLVSCLPTELRCNGVCVDVSRDREHCGTCEKSCAPSEQCSTDATNVTACRPFCAAGQTACAQTGGGFICQNLSNDRTNCGTCGNSCPQGQVCTPPSTGAPGHCAIECVPGLTNCSGNCLDLSSDDASCGACGNVCSAGKHCLGGHCSVICTPGQTECPPASGICVDLTKDRGNCGGCGVNCASGQICTASSCQVSCQTGLSLCSSTCVNTVADANNCGGCGNLTTGAFICRPGQVCTNHGVGGSGVCELRCPAGETACGSPAWNAGTPYYAGNQVTNGGNLYQCATAGTSAATGSGPAGTATSTADGSVAWSFVSAAATGATQCVNLQTDRNNCGACDDVTNSKACSDGQICLGGVPVVSCAPGLKQCNGTCVDTRNDPANCGSCGKSCSATGSAGPVCGNGLCGVSCPGGEINCGGKCVDTFNDPNNCGTGTAACGTACLTGQVCVGGGCTLRCPTGSVACGSKCIDPLHDNGNCGANASCTGGVPCAFGTACGSDAGVGQCLATCAAGFSNCGGVCKDTQADPANCGACGNVCRPSAAFICANDGQCAAGQLCRSGACTGGPGYPNAAAFCNAAAVSPCGLVCAGTFADCDLKLDNGCETDLSSAPSHCGSCLNACPAADNANPSCASSACGISCRFNLGNCDGDATNGCEANVQNDAQNCGACGTACSGATPYCSTSCVAFAAASGVQENLSTAAITADWGAPCFTETYAHVGTTLAAIQAVCPSGTQVMVACAAPGAPTLLVAAWGPRATVFTTPGTSASGVTFYGAGSTAFGFAPAGAATTLSPFDIGGSAADGFVAGLGSQRLSWPVQTGGIVAGGRCGDRVGPGATSNYQRLVFTK